MKSQISTQSFLEFEDIKEGVLILKDGSLRLILMISSLNFELKSETDRESIIYQFQNFLNSLDFPIQIIVQSRKLNIQAYIDFLKELEANQIDPLLKKQTSNYISFIESLIKKGSVMSKNFFLVIPFAKIELFGKEKYEESKEDSKTIKKIPEETFQEMKIQILQRAEFVALALRRIGLLAIPLTTEELIDLFWAWHHPREAEVGYFPKISPELLKHQDISNK